MKRSLSRRDFLKAGGVTLVAVVGGSVWRTLDQGLFSAGQSPAYEAWQNWRSAASPTELIVAAGILASNPHNSQPWIFRLTASSIDLIADPSRQIGVIDPFQREMYLGLGCCLENMVLATETEGFDAAIKLLPNSTDLTQAAHLELIPAAPRVLETFFLQLAAWMS